MISAVMLYFFELFKSLSLLGAFLSMFIENIAIPLPTEIGYLIGHDLIARGRYSYLVVLFVLTLGHVAGSVISYYIGRLGDNYIKDKISKSSKVKEVHDKLELWYRDYGNLTVFITRFVGYVRPWSSIVAGLAEVPLGPFVLWTTLGSLIFNIINIYFAGIFILIWRRYEALHFLLISLAITFTLAVFIYGAIKHYRSKKRSGG